MSILLLGPVAAGGQIVRDSSTIASGVRGTNTLVTVESAMRARSDFERFRFDNLPAESGSGSCLELPRNDCYWADAEPPPLSVEPTVIQDRREQLISLLDTVAVLTPGDRWAVEQRVRYLEEAGRPDSALSAARACRVPGWACDALVGFALHQLGRYRAADSTYRLALAQMNAKVRCDWRSVDLLIDDDMQRQYAQLSCGDSRRDALEDRIWYYARTLYSLDGNDSRTEHYARKTMEMMLHDAPDMLTDSVLRPNSRFAEAILDSYLRFSWPRGWAISRGSLVGSALAILGGGRGGRGWRLFPYLPRPSYRYVPPGVALTNPSMSDSSDWNWRPPPSGNHTVANPRITRQGNEVIISGGFATQGGDLVARYAPPYAKSITALEHQKAMFKRGDSALVVLAYDARAVKPLAGGTLTAALVVTPNGTPPVGYAKIAHDAPGTGVLIAKAPWGPLLMSAEVYALDKQAVARARYGISPPVAVGTRVTLSDLLLYRPFGTFPATVEVAARHALATERVMANDKLGVYWESYGTDPAGERMKVSLTVLKEVGEAGFLKRKAESLKLVREATPVVVSVEDLSALGAHATPRALEVDISTLKKGSYVVQLEVDVAGQYTVRAEHRIEVIGP